MTLIQENTHQQILKVLIFTQVLHLEEHIDTEARRGPASREHSPVKHSGTKDLPSPAHSLKDSIAHKESPASGGPDSRDHSTAKCFRGVDSSMHIAAHIELHKKVILLVEALIQRSLNSTPKWFVKSFR